MKLTILAVLAAGTLGPFAFGNDNNNTGPMALAVTQDGHGGSHFLYYQTNPSQTQDTMTVALYTNSGGVVSTNLVGRDRPLTDNGATRFVIGTNQHGVANAAYVPQSSQFAQATQ
jgi:hypothetical protein